VDWCVDPAVDGAVEATLHALTGHLERHASRPEAELAADLVGSALATVDPQGRWWLHLDWRDLHPVLRLGTLSDPRIGPGPSGGGLLELAPGLADASDLEDELAALHVPHTTIQLPAVRRFLPHVDPPDPDPASVQPTGDLAETMAMVARELAVQASHGRPGEAGAASAGVRLARSATRVEPSLESVAAAFAELSASHGGGFRVVEVTDTHAVLATRRCPFGAQVRDAPELCHFTAAALGRMATSALDADVHVSLHERLALGDTQCRMVVSLDDLGLPGWQRYRSEPAGWPDPPAREPVVTRGFRIALSLRLPRDRLSVPLIRHLARKALDEVGVIDEHVGDVELAITEACTNVLDHAGPGDAYDVELTVRPDACDIRVIDIGHGFDAGLLGEAMAEPSAEEGRGISLMHALMDQVRLASEPESGTIVHLVKALEFDNSVPARRLMLDALTPDDDEESGNG
jgi:serine/threonine-protein kinase RsbW